MLLNEAQQQLAIDRTDHWIARANELWQLDLPPLEVLFDLRGKAWGMYLRRGNTRWFRYNPALFARAWDDSLNDTIPHEVAHYVVDSLGLKLRPKPHGKEWRAVMNSFGITQPKATHNLNLSDLALRRQRRYTYYCRCGEVELTATRHRRILRQTTQYRCRRCGERLSATAPK